MSAQTPKLDYPWNKDFDEGRFIEDMKKQKAPRNFGIFFTLRSGSSWLTDVLSQTRLLGKPREWFNPNFVPNISRSVNAYDLDSYIKMLRRKHKAGGFFSFEITIYQMRRMFGSGNNFLSYFPPSTTFFYLTREDILLQAVSLAKAVRTSVFHTAHASPEAIAEAERNFDYDAQEIAHWLDHILDQERLCEAFFKKNGITPHRLAYEQITTDGAEVTAKHFLRIMRPVIYDRLEIPTLTTNHTKLASERNQAFAETFRRENPEKMLEIKTSRDQFNEY